MRASRALREISIYALALALIAFILGPILWLGAHAFATSWTFPRLSADGWTLHWWHEVLADSALAGAIRTSLLITPVVVLISAVICLPAAYAIGRHSFPGRRFLLIGIFAANAFPKIGLFASLAALFYAMNLMGTVVGIVIVQLLGTIVFMTWIPASAFAAVPRALEEAARDAGASRFTVFRTITLRMAMPSILVAIIMAFLASFDEAQGSYLVGAPNIYTMPTEMYALVENYPIQVAAVFSILLSAPSVLLIGLAHRHIIGGRLAEGFQIR